MDRRDGGRGIDRRTLLAVGGGLALAGCTARPPGDTDGDGGAAPEPVSREFSRTGDCDDPGSATVTFEEDAVRVAGCIRGSNGCARAALAGAAYDAGTDTLRVAVEAVEERSPGEACTEALVNRGYEARVGFEGGLPGAVVVVHDNFEGERAVARATR